MGERETCLGALTGDCSKCDCCSEGDCHFEQEQESKVKQVIYKEVNVSKKKSNLNEVRNECEDLQVKVLELFKHEAKKDIDDDPMDTMRALNEGEINKIFSLKATRLAEALENLTNAMCVLAALDDLEESDKLDKERGYDG